MNSPIGIQQMIMSFQLNPEQRCRVYQCLLVLIISYGALLRMDRLFCFPDFVIPDAPKHFIATEQLRGDDPIGWFSVYRGYAPFTWVLRFFFGITSHQPIVQRFVTVLISVLMIYLLARIVQARLGEWAALFAANLIAINPAIIESADTGIREAPFTVLWLTMFLLVFIWKPATQYQESFRRVALGLVFCLTLLIRIDSLFALVGFLVIGTMARGFWRTPREWFEGLGSFMVFLGVIMLANGIRHDDPFYFVDREKSILRWWANVEFQGQPGFPSVEEVRANSRAGEPLSAFQYFGEILGWEETAKRFIKGYAKLYVKHILTGIYRFNAYPTHISFVGILTVIGMLYELYRRRWVIPVMIPLLFLGAAWTYDIKIGHDFRLFLVAVPFVIILVCEGGMFVWQQFQRIPQVWVRRTLESVVLILVLQNPWNHDRKVSFPWRVGPVSSVPAQFQFDSGMPEKIPHLVGFDFREVGPLGFQGSKPDHFEPRRIYLARTWWQLPEVVSGIASYRITTFQEGKGTLGVTRFQPLTRKYPLRFWQPGQIVLDELEYYWVHSKPIPGPVELRIEVMGDGVIEDATYTTVFNAN